ncbi:MAG: aminotransferase class I/II-fold pyridoxal phosphate-dependent enzyme [Saprospiraceae bacterium]|nr:aminotransferase class I/II-fold pyridoxal phosphate-dependent enzyme [Bacteroidia bacterium]NNE15888.1 aminotransferase class I/II-fold pyridoxal phosphate-dependent enzyme [Saprospiraceae bacterium]NNL93416.1 aminotransferase class I/II-fold pyridoxal phosphate-dependent enzyme [Saprospiraceae bacterium]
MSTEPINIFKESLLPNSSYKGGKGKAEVADLFDGKKLYKLSSNENILGSSPLALQAIEDNIGKLSEYCDRTDDRLRHALSNYYNNELSANQFFSDNSGVSLLNLIERAFLEKGHEIIVCNPAFKPYAVFAKKLQAKVVDVPLVGDDLHLNDPDILNAINDQTRLIFITSPNNPTGTYIPKKQMDALVASLPDHVVLVYDEVYFQFVDAPDYVRAHEYVKQGKNVIGVNSFSKAYGLAGLRLGYGYSTEKIARYVAQASTPFMINTLALEAGIAALKDDAFIDKTVNLVNGEKDFLYSSLDQLNIKYWKSQANFILIKPDMNDKAFELQMLKEGIMVRTVANFGAPGCIRVTIGDREANTAYISALTKVINTNK